MSDDVIDRFLFEPEFPAPPSVATTVPSVFAGITAPTARLASEVKRLEKLSAANPSVSFYAGWNQKQHGAAVAGGKLTIRYDPNRAEKRGGTLSGFPAWGVEAYARFQPSGEVVHAPAVTFELKDGAVTGRALQLPVTVDVPLGSTEIELWFKNWSMHQGAPDVFYDSKFGENFRVPVLPSATS